MVTVTASDAASPGEWRKLSIQSGDDVDRLVATFCAGGPFRDEAACIRSLRVALSEPGVAASLSVVEAELRCRAVVVKHRAVKASSKIAYHGEPMNVTVELEIRISMCVDTNVSEFIPRFCSERPWMPNCEQECFESLRTELRKPCTEPHLQFEARTHTLTTCPCMRMNTGNTRILKRARICHARKHD
jgi:hypothetical protein